MCSIFRIRGRHPRQGDIIHQRNPNQWGRSTTPRRSCRYTTIRRDLLSRGGLEVLIESGPEKGVFSCCALPSTLFSKYSPVESAAGQAGQLVALQDSRRSESRPLFRRTSGHSDVTSSRKTSSPFFRPSPKPRLLRMTPRRRVFGSVIFETAPLWYVHIHLSGRCNL